MASPLTMEGRIFREDDGRLLNQNSLKPVLGQLQLAQSKIGAVVNEKSRQTS